MERDELDLFRTSLARATGARRGEAFDAALDQVRDRYGSDAITRAALLHAGQGFTVPLLPD